MLGVAADVLGVLRLMGTGAVRMIPDQVKDNIILVVIGQVIGAVIVGEEAVQAAAPPLTTMMDAAVSVRLLCFSAVMPMRALSSSSLFSVMVVPAAR